MNNQLNNLREASKNGFAGAAVSALWMGAFASSGHDKMFLAATALAAVGAAYGCKKAWEASRLATVRVNVDPSR